MIDNNYFTTTVSAEDEINSLLSVFDLSREFTLDEMKQIHEGMNKDIKPSDIYASRESSREFTLDEMKQLRENMDKDIKSSDVYASREFTPDEMKQILKVWMQMLIFLIIIRNQLINMHIVI